MCNKAGSVWGLEGHRRRSTRTGRVAPAVPIVAGILAAVGTAIGVLFAGVHVMLKDLD